MYFYGKKNNLDRIISLELLKLRVPAHVALGTRASLSCRWVLGPADVLYSVKWYKDGKEFFRHVPRDHEPRRKFPLPGVDVEEADPSGASLVLSAAVLETGGRYRCEVSGERPLFPTVSGHADMDVVVLPEEAPVLTGLRSRYRLGDRVQVNCTSGRSRPACQLSWYINSEPVLTSALLPAIHNVYEDGLETTSLQLDFILTELHFKQSGLKVKCLATLAELYWRSNEGSALLDKGKIRHTLTSFEPKRNTRADHIQSNVASLLNSSSILIIILLLVPSRVKVC
ncbi:irregular chiasm C-roughest protein-like [Helicoverpa zea]|uniref:irregular chiasm C-roughest protein-like n=1 Tax=Helicoverpa zea TaxID=7113 RepID=UPI001F566CDB|nr:irregular chiasm C-roughest protein-like [Helicoverpa zea]